RRARRWLTNRTHRRPAIISPGAACRILPHFDSPTTRDSSHPRKTRRPSPHGLVLTHAAATSWPRKSCAPGEKYGLTAARPHRVVRQFEFFFLTIPNPRGSGFFTNFLRSTRSASRQTATPITIQTDAVIPKGMRYDGLRMKGADCHATTAAKRTALIIQKIG